MCEPRQNFLTDCTDCLELAIKIKKRKCQQNFIANNDLLLLSLLILEQFYKNNKNKCIFSPADSPTCKHERIIVVGASRGERIDIACEIEADPPAKSYRWKFNNSGETMDVETSRFVNTSNGTVSILPYTPINELDYGSLSCWAVNSVGHQVNPCLFQLVAAGKKSKYIDNFYLKHFFEKLNINNYGGGVNSLGHAVYTFDVIAGKPFPVRNCTLSNQTSSSVEVFCLPGFDGGLPQYFLLELYSSSSEVLRYNITSSTEPDFFLDNLEPDVTFRIVVFAVNAKGRSHGVVLEEVTFRDAEKRTGK